MLRNFLKSFLGENYTESHEKYAKINFAIIALMFLVSAVMLLFLPEKIEILHNGDTNYPIPSIIGVWLCPAVALLINISFMKQKRLSPMNTGIMVLLFFISTGYYLTLM